MTDKIDFKTKLEDLEVFKQQKFYPHLLVRQTSGGYGRVIETLVRLQADGKQYLVYCLDEYSSTTDNFEHAFRAFATKVYMTKMLFKVPEPENVFGYPGLYADPDQRTEMEKMMIELQMTKP